MASESASPTTRPGLDLVQEIPLVGECLGDKPIYGRLDHMCYDASTKVLYLCCLGADCVLAVDVFAGVVRQKIDTYVQPRDTAAPGMQRLEPLRLRMPQGAAFDLRTNALLVSCAGGELMLFKRRGSAPHEHEFDRGTLLDCSDADNMRIVPTIDQSTDDGQVTGGRVVIGAGDGELAEVLLTLDRPGAEARTRSEAPLDPATAPVRAALSRLAEFDNHPEGLAVTRNVAFVNIADSRRVCRVPTGSDVASAGCGPFDSVTLPDGFRNNFSIGALSLDDDQRCIVSTRTPPRLFVVQFPPLRRSADEAATDSPSANFSPGVPSVGDVDDICVDQRRGLAYVCGGDGAILCVDTTNTGEDGAPVAWRLDAKTDVGARTALWVPERDRLYVAAPARGSCPARLLVFAPSQHE